MTPLELSILIHYRGCANDFRDGDFSAPAVRDAIDRFRDVLKLIEFDNTETKHFSFNETRTYRLTERGRVFVDALCEAPLPIQAWVMPSEDLHRKEPN